VKTDEMWALLDESLTEISERQAWLEQAAVQYGRSVTNPAPGYAAALHNLDIAKAKARGRAEIIGIVYSKTADDVIRAAMGRRKR
jgi:hypothetical protein